MNKTHLPFFDLDSMTTQKDFLAAISYPKRWIPKHIHFNIPNAYAFRVGGKHNLGHIPNNVICYASPDEPVLEGDFVLAFLKSGIIELRRDFFARRIQKVSDPQEAKKILQHQAHHTIHKIFAIIAEGSYFGESNGLLAPRAPRQQPQQEDKSLAFAL